MFVVRPGVSLVEYEQPYVCFSYFGNAHYLKLEGLDFPIGRLFEFLRQPKTWGDIKSEFSNHPDLENNFRYLQRDRYVTEVVESDAHKLKGPLDPLTNLCMHFFNNIATSEKVLAQLKGRHVTIVDQLGVCQEMVTSLNSLGIEKINIVTSTNQLSAVDLDYSLVIGSWTKSHSLGALNRWYLKNKKDYFLVFVDIFGGSLGPMLAQPHGPCFSCFRQRRNSNLSDRRWVDRVESWSEHQPGSFELGFFPVFSRMLFQMAALEVFKHFTEISDKQNMYGVNEIDHFNIRTKYHEVLPSPNCEECFAKQNLHF